MKLASYEALEILHIGSNTEIFAAASLEHSVVLKISRQGAPAITEGRLRHEYNVLEHLRSVPGVVRTKGWLDENGRVGIILENHGWRSLDAVLAQHGRFSVKVSLHLAILIAQALAGVHAAGVIHKDVKPQNILADELLGHALLIDFGIASRLSHESPAATVPEALEGTLGYISPEQTGRTARTLDCRTDLYSLGVTLFEVLTGRLPFTETDLMSLVYAHLAKQPPALEALLADVPKGVAAVVAKLLEKDPDRRYQTAQGAAYDLERCQRELTEQGTVELFALGSRDFSSKLRIPQVLVGKAEEEEQVRAAFARAAKGSMELLLIGGPSGIGKTALVRTVYRDIAARGAGTLLNGKYDQLSRSMPLSALAQAFGQLMKQILARREEILAEWRNRLVGRMGENLQLLLDAIPELQAVVGTLPAVPEVPSDQTLNRLKVTWNGFVNAIIEASAPLVLFLDDLQWADGATFLILESLLTDSDRRSFLIIGAYRDNEVSAGHPLWGLIEAAEKAGTQVSRMSMGPLTRKQTSEWTTLALESPSPHETESLAEALFAKTRGNPFFLGQLLLSLHRQRVIERDLETGRWHWNVSAISLSEVTENVIAFLTEEVRRMPEATQALLGLAACAGYQFRLSDVGRLGGSPHNQLVKALWPALEQEIVVPVDGAYRMAQAMAVTSDTTLDAEYRFLHDRVQQASYEQIPVEQRSQAHLEIGQRLKIRYRTQGGNTHDLLELTHHLNLGAKLLTRAGERTALAMLNLEAARVAKRSGEYGLMAKLLDAAEQLLGQEAWTKELRLEAQRSVERLEAAYFQRMFDEVEARANALATRPLPSLLSWSAIEIQLRALVTTGAFAKGIELGIKSLGNEPIPRTEEAATTEFIRIAKNLQQWIEAAGGTAAFDAMGKSCDALVLAQESVWMRLYTCAALGGRPALAAWIVARNVGEVRRRGLLNPVSSFWISMFANAWSMVFETYRRAVLWASAGRAIATRMNSPIASETSYVEGLYAIYHAPVDDALAFHAEAIRVGTQHGSYQGVSLGLVGMLITSLWRGAALINLSHQIEEKRGVMLHLGDVLGQECLTVMEGFCTFLSSTPNSDSRTPRDGLLTKLCSSDDGFAVEIARVLESYLYLTWGNVSAAAACIRETQSARGSLNGLPIVTDRSLWLALAGASELFSRPSQERNPEYSRWLDQGVERFTYLATGCPRNFQHKLRLVEAESARVHGRGEEAMTKYDEAIELARNERCLHIEALSAQRCAEFHFSSGRKHLALHYFHTARDGYSRWGANAAVAHLELQYPDCFRTVVRSTTIERTVRTSFTEGLQLDIATAVRAAQVLSSEVHSERIVGRLMELVLENAGAQYGILVLSQGEALIIVARLRVDGGRIETGLSEPIDRSDDLAIAVVEYVARRREPVVLDGAYPDPRFSSTRRMRTREVQSVLAVPLVHQGRLGGVLYLDHATPAAFPTNRVSFLGVLASQAAIALENAKLYEEMRRLNEGLEAEVATRTAQLQKALSDLWSEVDLARKIQTVLLPDDGKFDAYELAATMRPADEVGGDYYDVISWAGHTWILIGDVSGHGVSAGLVMMMVQTAVRAVIRLLDRPDAPLSPARMLAEVNSSVFSNLERIGRNQYMTITALRIEGLTIKYAGLHLDLALFRAASDKVERLPTFGIWLGLVVDAAPLLQDACFEMADGDVLLLYTDGLSESRDKGRAMLGFGGLIKLVERNAWQEKSARQLIDTLFKSLEGRTFGDDVTILALRCQGVATAPSPSQVRVGG